MKMKLVLFIIAFIANVAYYSSKHISAQQETVKPASQTINCLDENTGREIQCMKPTPVVLKCPAPIPVCKGGLISQNATPKQINDYYTRWNLTAPLSCRFQQPPRCYIGQDPACEECTK